MARSWRSYQDHFDNPIYRWSCRSLRKIPQRSGHSFLAIELVFGGPSRGPGGLMRGERYTRAHHRSGGVEERLRGEERATTAERSGGQKGACPASGACP
jgi:hypothetical protein